MTREEAIFCEKSYLGKTNCIDCKYYGTDTCKSRESHKMAISALNQEPCRDAVLLTKEAYSQLCLEASKWNELQLCEDAVSRQTVLKEFEKGSENLYGRIDKLPSVNPQPCDYAISRADVISVINILADKMDESGKTAAEQFISAIKDMR